MYCICNRDVLNIYSILLSLLLFQSSLIVQYALMECFTFGTSISFCGVRNGGRGGVRNGICTNSLLTRPTTLFLFFLHLVNRILSLSCRILLYKTKEIMFTAFTSILFAGTIHSFTAALRISTDNVIVNVVDALFANKAIFKFASAKVAVKYVFPMYLRCQSVINIGAGVDCAAGKAGRCGLGPHDEERL